MYLSVGRSPRAHAEDDGAVYTEAAQRAKGTACAGAGCAQIVRRANGSPCPRSCAVLLGTCRGGRARGGVVRHGNGHTRLGDMQMLPCTPRVHVLPCARSCVPVCMQMRGRNLGASETGQGKQRTKCKGQEAGSAQRLHMRHANAVCANPLHMPPSACKGREGTNGACTEMRVAQTGWTCRSRRGCTRGGRRTSRSERMGGAQRSTNRTNVPHF